MVVLMLRKIIIIAVTVLFVYSTNFGWRMFTRGVSDLETNQLSTDLEKHVRILSEEIGNRSVFAFEKLRRNSCLGRVLPLQLTPHEQA